MMSRLYLFEDPFENSDLDVVVDLNEIAAVEPEPKMDDTDCVDLSEE